MPNYTYQCSKCNHLYSLFKTIKNMDRPLNQPCPSCLKNGNIIRMITAPSLGDSRKLEMTKGLLKPTKEFNDILRTIKKNNVGSTIEVRD